MKRLAVGLVVLLLAGLVLELPAAAQTPALRELRPTARIEKKNGETVVGEIQGRIVEEVRMDKAERESGTAYHVLYIVLAGNDIEAIDELGISAREGSPALIVMFSAKAEPAEEVLNKWLSIADGLVSGGLPTPFALKSSVEDLKIQVDLLHILKKEESTRPTRLLGEYRDGDIIPALKVLTATGFVTIPVADIVEFFWFKPAETKPAPQP